jgi:glutamate:Na+ symporter, ESS family
MRTVALSELQTVILALVALLLGRAISTRLKFLRRLNVPVPVVGGVLAALALAGLRAAAGIEVSVATSFRDILLLVFFTTIGLSAKLSSLKAGGAGLLILCGVTVLLLVLQNLIGIGIALSRGAHPFYGLLLGSLSFVGGPGTALAWAREGEAMGLRYAPEIALGTATLAVVSGALVAGPITGWLITRRGLHAATSHTDAPAVSSTPAIMQAASMEQLMRTMLLVAIAVAIGQRLNEWAAQANLVLPGFLTAMLGGVIIANGADLFHRRLDFQPIERGGEWSLQLFLVMSLMSLKLWTLAAAAGPLLINVVAQIAVSVLLALLVLFPLLGRDYEAAVASGGFLGFGLSSMPVALATMDEVSARFGPAPRAFLLITLAGSFFVDLANALVTKAFLLLPIFAR